MGVVQVKLPQDLGVAVEREVAAGHASSAEDYVALAVREYLSFQDELAAEAEAGIEDIETGRFEVIDDLEIWGAGNLERARKLLANQPTPG